MLPYPPHARTPSLHPILISRSPCSARIRAVAAVAAAMGGDASIASESVTVVSTSQGAAEGVASHAVIQVPPQLSPAAVRAALKASQHVEAVVPNRVVRIAQATGSGECTIQ